jgi:hypothetical protein
MKKIFLGLLVVPAIAFGMQGSNKSNAKLIDAVWEYNNTASVTRMAYRDTELPNSFARVLGVSGAVLMCISRQPNINGINVGAEVCSVGCCLALAIEGYRHFYTVHETYAMRRVAHVIRNDENVDMASLETDAIKTWAGPEIQQAIKDRKATEALSSSAQMQ